MASRLKAWLAVAGLQLLLMILQAPNPWQYMNNADGDAVSTFWSGSAPKGVVAYAISFTQCDGNINVLDAPAVLAHSIHLNSHRHVPHLTGYDYHLIAFIHPMAVNCTQHIEKLGYEVQLLPEPVTVEEIETDQYSSQVRKRGCCSIREFMKLYAYALTKYEVVVHLDADVILLQPMDELYDGMKTNNMSEVATFRSPPYSDAIDFLFTRDYGQLSFMTTDPTKYAVQGGFFVVRPNLTILEEMKGIIRNGAFGPRMGWGRKYYGGYWGDPQIQGFLSYFYGEFYPHRAVELNPCIYSTIAVRGLDDNCTCRFGSEINPCPDCTAANISDIKMTHYTSCYKPWWCPKTRRSQLCRDFHAAWFQLILHSSPLMKRIVFHNGGMISGKNIDSYLFCVRATLMYLVLQ